MFRLEVATTGIKYLICTETQLRTAREFNFMFLPVNLQIFSFYCNIKYIVFPHFIHLSPFLESMWLSLKKKNNYKNLVEIIIQNDKFPNFLNHGSPLNTLKLLLTQKSKL